MFFKQFKLRHAWLYTALLATLALAGCSDDDKKGIVLHDQLGQGGAMFHGAQWATIKDLDPRGEQCVDCHGRNNDMSPYTNGTMAHNIGLQKNTDHSAYADLKITGVKVNETSGEVTVTLNQALPANAGNLSMTFAKLAPRVIHNRGHDWQNYFTSNALGRGGNEPASEWFASGGVAPQTVPNPEVSGNTITFNLGGGTGRSWGDHSFKVKSAYATDTAEWDYQDVKGTKFSATGWDIAKHVYCDEAYAGGTSGNNDAASPANQLADKDNHRPICWWPDGTHLTSGVFVSLNHEFIVAYEPDYTHRVSLILSGTPAAAGNPGFNIWFDFVPSVANGDKTPAQLTVTDTANNITYDAVSYIKPNTGEVIAADYQFNSAGRGLPNSNAAGNFNLNSETTFHQKLPAARDVVDVQSCNSCHDGLAMHGGSGRSQTQTCVTCHNPGNLQASSGRSVDFKQLIHRLHRGSDLPSESTTIANRMNDGTGLTAETASDFTKVRFPQGRTPGNPEGITNCVKCHMGENTNALVQDFASTLGAGADFNVAKEMKLALVTPQGDNWLGVRSVNACQACHDSNVWIADGSINKANPGIDDTSSTDLIDNFKLDKYMPFYTDKYADVGFHWLGKKLQGTASGGGGPWAPGRIHNTETPDNGGRFTCGSGGGCHGNNNMTDINSAIIGGATQIAIENVHLRLTRNYILAQRFEVQISNPVVTNNGQFSADVQLIDKKTNAAVEITASTGNNGTAQIDDLDAANPTALSFGANMGWRYDSSDYNHSPGGSVSPGVALVLSIQWNGTDTGKITSDLSAMPRSVEWEKLQGNFDKVIGTVFVEARTTNLALNFTTPTVDFRFDGQPLGTDEGRREVVDFFAGNGLANATDANANRYSGWDKHDGANTQSCSSCHLELSYHGGARRTNNVQACVVCHNAQRTDINNGSRQGVLRAEDGQYEESLDFKRLIHIAHAAGGSPDKGGTNGFRIDPMFSGQGGAGFVARPNVGTDIATVKGNSFPGKLDNCQACHIENDQGQWTFELTALPKDLIGSTAISADWQALTAKDDYDYAVDGAVRHDFANHMKMTPIASVCSSCHDAGYKTSEGRMNNNILDGGPYVGSHWWVMGGIAPGIVPDNGTKPSATKHQSGL